MTVITPRSPLGAALLGKQLDDEVQINVGAVQRVNHIAPIASKPAPTALALYNLQRGFVGVYGMAYQQAQGATDQGPDPHAAE